MPSFLREMTTTVLWLNERKLDIRCISVAPYETAGSYFLEIKQLIQLPSAADYIVQKRAKKMQAGQQASTKKDQVSWLTLVDNGTLQLSDQLELPRLPNNVLAAVSGMSGIAELLLEPGGQIR